VHYRALFEKLLEAPTEKTDKTKTDKTKTDKTEAKEQAHDHA
jgi:hypothetical protein